MKNYVKVVLLGDGILHINLGRVGKTSIINKFVKNKFDETSESTLNSYYLEKEVEFENHKFTLCIWDTAGQEKFNALTPIYYRGAKAAVLVYDVGLSETFKKVKKWIAELREFNKEANTIVIAGNKVDLKKFDIEKESILKYAEEEQAVHYFTSAKTGENINDVFNFVAKSVGAEFSKKNSRDSKKIVISKNKKSSEGSEKKKNCC